MAVQGATEFFGAWLQAAAPRGRAQSVAPPEPPLLRDYKPKFFDADDFAALQAFTEILIPTDETPGAREARCAHFIDFVLDASSAVAPDTARQWRQAMRALKEAGFHRASPAGRETIVAAMAKPERERAASHPAYFAYRLIKQQNTFAFYTSRAGLIEALDYKGNTYNATFPACDHPEHRVVT
jgi:gluconate 2-dehydrogenase gamma chain